MKSEGGIPTLSIIAPCHNEIKVIPDFLEKIRAELQGLALDYELILIDDGSTDGTRQLLAEESKKDTRVKVVFLSRNFGKEAALTAGLDWATGLAVIPIDVDLQDPPELIKQMVAKWKSGFEVVNAIRVSRQTDSAAKRVSARTFYWLFNALSNSPIPMDGGDFRLLDRRVVDVLKNMPERNRFMKGMFMWPGFRHCEVTYERMPRHGGVSKFNYWRLWNFALDGLTSFTTAPLRIWTYIGVLIAVGAMLYAVFLLVRTLWLGVDVPGYASVMIVMLFLGGIQLISLGIIGEYLGRAYIEVKHRPIYVIDGQLNFE